MYEKIKDLCDKKGMTGSELGKLLGLKKSPLTDWKNKKAKPTIEQLKIICEYFAISADELLELNIQHNSLSEEEKEMIENLRLLPEREKYKFYGRIEEAAEKYKNDIEESSTSKVG